MTKESFSELYAVLSFTNVPARKLYVILCSVNIKLT